MRKLLLVIASICVVEFIVYLYAAQITHILDLRYQLAARFSARISFLMFSGLVVWIGIEGLREISIYKYSRRLLVYWMMAIGVNHLIHFYYLAMNYHLKELSLLELNSAGGAVAYILLLSVPIILIRQPVWTEMTKRMIWGVIAFIELIFTFAYIKRLFKGEELASPSYYYVIALAIVVVCVILNIYRLIEDGKKRQSGSSLT